MNFQEYLDYRKECPLCQKRLITCFYFSIYKSSDGLLAIYQYLNSSLIKNSFANQSKNGLFDGLPSKIPLPQNSSIPIFKKRGWNLNSFYIKTKCPKEHYCHETRYFQKGHHNVFPHAIEILQEYVNVENIIVSNFVDGQTIQTFEIENRKLQRLPSLPITTWQPSNMREQIYKYLVLE